VADSVDPLAGSYYIESLTNEIERRALDYIKQIEDLGGSVRAIEHGFMQSEIEREAYNYQLALERGEAIVVGVNRFGIEQEEKAVLQQIHPEVGRRQARKLAELREKRDNEKVGQALHALSQGAAGKENLMPLIIDAVEAYATLGEISDTMRHVFGEQREFRSLE
jgi:methylmalonyl-CoA mutase N-terminal domain/subunit